MGREELIAHIELLGLRLYRFGNYDRAFRICYAAPWVGGCPTLATDWGDERWLDRVVYAYDLYVPCSWEVMAEAGVRMPTLQELERLCLRLKSSNTY